MEQSGLIDSGKAENVNSQTEHHVIVIKPEGDGTGAQNVESSSIQDRIQKGKEDAPSFAGFLFWTHVIGVILLLAGFVAPGWLTIKTRQTVLTDYETTRSSKLVFQDYSLWYITQCMYSLDVMMCESMTYRLIDAALEGTCYSCQLEISDFKTESFMLYSGAGLVFSYGKLVGAQVLYTLGILIAVYSFREFRTFRKNVSEAKDDNMTTNTWIFMLLVESLCAVFVLYPTFMFLSMNINVGRDSQFPVGSVLGMVGGIMMVVVTFTIILQIICCKNNKGVYLCYSEAVPEQLTPEDEECQV